MWLSTRTIFHKSAPIVLETCCAIPRATPLQDLREAFRIFDKDRSGYIDSKEIIAVTTTLGQALTKEELEQFMAEADLDGDGKLNYEEFVKVMTKDWDWGGGGGPRRLAGRDVFPGICLLLLVVVQKGRALDISCFSHSSLGLCRLL